MKTHPLADIFPMIEDEGILELAESIGKNGQRKSIVIYEGRILDGRNRYKACLVAGVPPRTEIYDPKIHGPNPLKFVLDENLHRRHLSTSQRAAIAAEIIVAENEFKKPSLPDIETPPNPGEKKPVKEFEEIEPDEGKKKTQAEAAAEMGVSPRSVATAKEIAEKDPEALQKVKEGKKTLNKASKELEANELADKKAKILQELQNDHGKEFAAAVQANTILKTAKELADFLDLELADQKLVMPLIATGWRVKKALGVAKNEITDDSTISDLINKAIQSETDELAILINGWEISAILIKDQ